MSIGDMFDKLDDIIYKPVETVCNWIQEPLRAFEQKRKIKALQNQADIEKNKEQQEAELSIMRERQIAKLQADQRRWNADIDAMIAEQEDARRDKLVESIKRYQIELASASRDIVNSIGLMSIELRSKANDLVLEKTQSYLEIQDNAKKQSLKELQEVKEMFFESDQETYRILVNDIMNERRSIIDTAGKFITELSEDLKRLNQNSDNLMRMGMETVTEYLKPMTRSLEINMDSNNTSGYIEDGTIVELNEDDYTSEE